MQEISFRDNILPLKDKLFRLALRITFDRAEAEDIVQDALIKVWNKRDEWGELESIEAYCLTVVRNLAIDRSQKKDDNRHGIQSHPPDTRRKARRIPPPEAFPPAGSLPDTLHGLYAPAPRFCQSALSTAIHPDLARRSPPASPDSWQ